MNVVDPDGVPWRVRRRWLPWRRRITDVPDTGLGGMSTGGDDPVSAIFAILALVVALPAILVSALLVAELLLLVVLLPLWVAVRAVTGGAWPIEVLRAKQLVRTESVRGWSASRERMLDLVEGIRLGRDADPAPLGASPPS